jgi:hypothetical protein
MTWLASIQDQVQEAAECQNVMSRDQGSRQEGEARKHRVLFKCCLIKLQPLNIVEFEVNVVHSSNPKTKHQRNSPPLINNVTLLSFTGE